MSQRSSRRIKNADVKQPRRSMWRWRTTTAIPSIETYVVMVTTGRNKRRLITHTLPQLATEHVAVEPEGAVKIGDLQVHMTYSNVGINRIDRHVSQLTTFEMSWQRVLGESGFA